MEDKKDVISQGEDFIDLRAGEPVRKLEDFETKPVIKAAEPEFPLTTNKTPSKDTYLLKVSLKTL